MNEKRKKVAQPSYMSLQKDSRTSSSLRFQYSKKVQRNIINREFHYAKTFNEKSL